MKKRGINRLEDIEVLQTSLLLRKGRSTQSENYGSSNARLELCKFPVLYWRKYFQFSINCKTSKILLSRCSSEKSHRCNSVKQHLNILKLWSYFDLVFRESKIKCVLKYFNSLNIKMRSRYIFVYVLSKWAVCTLRRARLCTLGH